MNRPLLLLVALLSGLLAAAGASAEVYKYKDKQGRIHFSDRPQAGWTPVEVKAPAPARPASDAEASDRAARRAVECNAKKQQLDNYRIATRVMEKDALGNEREYSAEQKQKLIDQTQRQVDELCAPAVAGSEPAEAPAAEPALEETEAAAPEEAPADEADAG